MKPSTPVAWSSRLASSICTSTFANLARATKKALRAEPQPLPPADSLPSAACRTRLPIVDSPEWVAWIQQPERGAVVNVFPIAAATHASKGAVLTDFGALQRAGAVAVSDDGRPILNDTIMRETLRAACGTQPARNSARRGHAHDGELFDERGLTSFRLGLRGMKTAAEASVVERDVQLAQQFTGARLHVAHLSTADALKAVRRGKRGKARVTCEVTPAPFQP